MDADFSGIVVAVCDVLERPCRSGTWGRLDRGSRLVFWWLQPGRGEAVAWLLHPVDGVPTAVHRCGRRCCHASLTQLKAPQLLGAVSLSGPLPRREARPGYSGSPGSSQILPLPAGWSSIVGTSHLRIAR